MFLYLVLPQLVFCNSTVSQPVSNMSVDWVGYGYAALVASGGVVGYVKAGSVPSLAAGLLFGGLAGFGAYQISNDPTNVWVSLATSGALTGVMGKRFYGSRKFMPAGLMAGASLLMVAKLGVTLLQKPQQS
ncbi:transmembrane protein 14C isoform X1 [Larimichthys crocea]|uniref:Transmembrane protein 14C n=2 Tax=Sciaenidae TaxID=30870 RepID=A0A4U5VJB7_COLLU|nr:transmembrane protein 14C isoform X1 [Larimichthys crocea]TKS87911.1 Transmembrane protein 14C [Collichthys lucidus]